ncbi:MAG: hypothetical protein MUF53_01465, partial [Gemmatimonadaceae bacterium]|nr:hypothetical protein [Gemmatimonadaceae bacterium]
MRGLAALGLSVIVIGCRPDAPLTEPAREVPRLAVTPVRCVVTRDGAACGAGQTSVAASVEDARALSAQLPAPMVPSGPGMADVLIGGANIFLRVGTAAATYDTVAQVLSLDLRVQNLMNQPMGTADGQTADADSIQLGLVTDPPVAVGGAVSVADALPTRDFGSGAGRYISFPAPLAGNATSVARTIRFNMPRSVTSFTLDLRVWAAVPDVNLGFAPSQAWTDVSVGNGVACGVRGGHVFCWGNRGLGINGDRSWQYVPSPRRVSGAPPFTRLAAGTAHACGMSSAGDVWCWGLNTSAQSGTGSLRSLSGPARAQLPTGVVPVDIAASTATSCLLDSTGAAWCWGTNVAGQVGDSTRTPRALPTLVRSPAAGVTLTSIRGANSSATADGGFCGVATDAQVYCWGINRGGRFGRNTSGDTLLRPLPTTGTGWTSVALGGSHGCVLAATGSASCMGAAGGFLGDGSGSAARLTPFAVVGGLAFREIHASNTVAGGMTCGLTNGADSAAYCWGAAPLGNGSLPTTAPTAVVGGLRFASLALGGGNVACGRTGAGAVYCWGLNSGAEVGLGTDPAPRRTVTTPTLVVGLPAVDEVVGGTGFFCARTTTDTWCWGWNGSGQLGFAADVVADRPRGVLTGGNNEFVAVMRGNAAAGDQAACASPIGAPARCWGTATGLVLGDGQPETPATGGIRDQLVPQAVASPQGGGPAAPVAFGRLALGRQRGCALAAGSTGAAYCWGRGIIGNGNGAVLPWDSPQYLGAQLFSRIAVSDSTSCALGTDGIAYCWGPATNNRLGRVTGTNAAVPTAVTMPSGVTFVDLDGGPFGFCAAGSDGDVYCWGVNSAQTLGGLTVGANIALPTRPAIGGIGLSGVTRVSTGSGLSCAAMATTVRCWGQNVTTTSGV